jgi:uncharacterized membrane protein YfhO
VLLAQDPGLPVPGLSEDPLSDTVELLRYTPNEIECLVKTGSPGFLVLADNWHPDWQAFVDGEQTPTYVANQTIRAIYVTAGQHEVVMKYLSRGYILGRIVSIIALVLVVGITAVSTRFKF